MVKLELFCSDATLDEVVRVIREASHTGNAGGPGGSHSSGEEQNEAV
jgi:nitrogen regulatory protein PII